MAGRTFQLEIVTPDRVVRSDAEVTSVVAPGSEGYLGIMAGHAPLLTELKVGRIDVKRDDNTGIAFATSGGFMEVSENSVIILADTAEPAEDIDVQRATEAKARAEERLAARTDPEVDAARAEVALMRALNRLHVAEEHVRR
jgi:F-type H+-transporting ATPase subunit epsilon